MSRPLDEKPIKLVRKRLDDDEVGAYLTSLAGHAQAIELRIKDAATSYSNATAEDLEEAGRRLRAGELMALQLRYCQDERWWCDTLMRKGTSFRLVRMPESEPT